MFVQFDNTSDSQMSHNLLPLLNKDLPHWVFMCVCVVVGGHETAGIEGMQAKLHTQIDISINTNKKIFLPQKE